MGCQYAEAAQQNAEAYLADLVDDCIHHFTFEGLHHNRRVMEGELCVSRSIENPTARLQIRQVIDTVDSDNITRERSASVIGQRDKKPRRLTHISHSSFPLHPRTTFAR
jgi:hypothetical protein